MGSGCINACTTCSMNLRPFRASTAICASEAYENLITTSLDGEGYRMKDSIETLITLRTSLSPTKGLRFLIMTVQNGA